MVNRMDGLRYSNIIIGIVTLILSHLIFKQVNKNQLVIYLLIIIVSILLTYIIDNEIILIIVGSIFTAALMNLFDFLYYRNRN